MASIAKLSVRGVRSFSPDDEEQVISFCLPLTIIVGANGCGKTTIIESLKYAVTGALPPGNKSGHAFVHDPKSVGSTAVKAAVKLRFTNRAGKSMVVVRSMEVTQKKSTMTFKALDGILRTTDENGERTSMSHKCSELDRQIPAMLGVSKPILEHVVFCHQEDASWPLQEGAVLKKRFDDIFDSTRYAKALEAIRVTKKEYQNTVKDHKADLAGLASHKHAAQGFRLDFDQAREALSNVDDDIHDLNTKIQEESARRSKSEGILNQLSVLQDDCDRKGVEIDKHHMKIATQQSMLEEDWTGTRTEDELHDMLKGFDQSIGMDFKQREKLEQKYEGIKADIERLQQQKFQINGQMGKLIGDRENYEKDLKKRVALMEEIASKYRIELNFSQTQNTAGSSLTHGHIGTQQSHMSAGSDTTAGGHDSRFAPDSQGSTITVTLEDLNAFQRALQVKEREIKNELIGHRKQSQAQEDELQSVLGDLNAKLKSIESDRARNESYKDDAMKELQALSNQLSFSRIRPSEIQTARENAEKFARDRDALSNDPRRSDIPKEIRSNEEQIDKLKRILEDENMALRDLRRCAEEQNAIDMLRRQVMQDFENLDDIKRENSFLLQKFNVTPNIAANADEAVLVNTMEELAESVRDKYETAKDGLSRASDDLTSAQQRTSEKKALLGHNQRILSQRKNQITVLNADDRGVQRIKRIIDAVRQFETSQGFGTTVDLGVEPQRLLEHLTKRIGECTTEEDQPEIISRTIKKLKKLSRVTDENGEVTDIICPCCTRSMSSAETKVFQNQIDVLSDPVQSAIVRMDQDKFQLYRSAIKNFESWRKTVSHSINDYLDYKRVLDEIEGMEVTVEQGDEEVKTLQLALDAATERASELETETSELRQLLNIANRLRDDANRIADKKSQIKLRQDELSVVAPSSNGRDLRTLEYDVNTKVEEKDNLMNAISRLNKEMSHLNDQVSRLSNQSSKAEQIAKDKEAKYEKEQAATVKKMELNDSILKYGEEDSKLLNQIAPLRQKARAKETEKQRLRSSAKADEDRLNDSLNQFISDVEKLNNLSAQIDEFIASNKLRTLETTETDLSAIAEDINEKEHTKVEMETELQEISKKLSNQERHKKTIMANIDLMHSRSLCKTLEDELTLLNAKVDDFDGADTASRDFQSASKMIKEYEAEKQRKEGSREEKKRQQRELKRKLATPEYHEIDERHRQKMIQHETTVIVVSDLEKYYTALDKALLRFHGMKIEEINKIIRELWTLTYKGEDITNIEIVSGEDTGSKSSRSYNYRVVMTKGNTHLDMRGRCSAGQRVLASVVIRLALAETFCLNCGVMALDEPTTNLDYANKRGLAIALAQIISNRASQHNFQLVTITHDEDFVSMMKNELATHAKFEMPEKYFQVSREEGADGCFYSKIHAIDWDEL